MVAKLHTQEIASWTATYAFTQADSYAWAVGEWGTVKGNQVAAEMAYIEYFDAVPEWAVYIEGFEVNDGSYLFIHRDPDAQQ